MVYCGKPSKGCTHCRKRRIKCDLVEPACSQCLRAGKTCSGYRDQLELMFRDENDKVLRKSKVPKGVKHPASPATNSAVAKTFINYGSTSRSPTGITKVSSSDLTHLNPLKDDGVRFFFTYYADALATRQNASHQELSKSPLWPLLFRSSSFFNTVSSVGYAGLANVTKDPKHAYIARKKYSVSLNDMTRALQDTSRTGLDTAFKSMLILAAFELVNGSAGGQGTWQIHVDGGVAILKLLAEKHNKGLIGMRMQTQFMFSLFVKCLHKGEAVPPDIARLSENLKDFTPEQDSPAIPLAQIISVIVSSRAEYQKKPIDPSYGYQKALIIDTALDDWEAQLPEAWKYETRAVTESDNMDFVYSGQTHIYRDMWTSRIWHNYRWARILVSELILAHMAQLGPFYSEAHPQRKRSSETINTMATDICVSVSSQFCGQNAQQAKDRQIPNVSGCFLLLFPLAIAGSAVDVSEELYTYCIETLKTFGNKLGVAQSLEVIPAMKRRREQWMAQEASPFDGSRCALFGGHIASCESFYEKQLSRT